MDGVLKWLEDNPVGMALSAVCGVLLLALIAMVFLSSLSLTPDSTETVAQESDPSVELPLLPENQPIDSYSVITERPLFNESRQPFVDEMGDANLLALDEDALNMDAPEVELAGVVITPSLRMVTLRRKDSDLSLVAFEGKPIEADFGTWQVSRIDARAATLTSASGEELHLEMKVHDEQIEQPAPAEKPERTEDASAEASGEQAVESAPLSRAEEIRQRIEERREELKREAEAAEQGEGEGEAEEASYENAIQSLITGGRKNPRDNDNEQ